MKMKSKARLNTACFGEEGSVKKYEIKVTSAYHREFVVEVGNLRIAYKIDHGGALRRPTIITVVVEGKQQAR